MLQIKEKNYTTDTFNNMGDSYKHHIKRCQVKVIYLKNNFRNKNNQWY